MAGAETNLFVREVKADKDQTYSVAVDRRSDGKLYLMIDQSNAGGQTKTIEVTEESFGRVYSALRAAKKVIGYNLKSKTPSAPTVPPPMAGTPWTKADEEHLIELHNQGESVGQLTKKFQRTRAEVASRLQKLGLIPKGKNKAY